MKLGEGTGGENESFRQLRAGFEQEVEAVDDPNRDADYGCFERPLSADVDRVSRDTEINDGSRNVEIGQGDLMIIGHG